MLSNAKIAASVVVGFSAAASAAIIPSSGITAFASDQYQNADDQRIAQKAVDGTGMTGDAHALGNSTGNQWSTNNVPVGSQWLVADLGQTYEMESLRLWNCNEVSPYFNRGVWKAKIWVTTAGDGTLPTAGTQGFDFDAAGWTQVGTDQFLFDMATGTADYVAPAGNTKDLSGYTARYVAIDVDSTDGQNNPDGYGYVGIAEIQFSGAIPEPASLSLLGLAALSLGRCRRPRA